MGVEPSRVVMRLRWLERICRKLLEFDPGIVEIVQYGSSVYSPELARDVDLLVVTRRARDVECYMDVVDRVDPPFDVDLVVVELGQRLREEFLRGVLGSFRVLYGDGRYVLEYGEMLGDPTFDEARAALTAARGYLELALRTTDTLVRDRHVREAFDTLFHAARIAAMTYLSTRITRWGSIRRMLPEPYGSQFREFINTLHIKYSYQGEYPREGVEDEFDGWYKRVKEFVDRLEAEIREKRR